MMHKVLAPIAFAFLFLWWVVAPLWTFNQGTSRNITSEVLAEPFAQGDSLIYRWSGEIFRLCPIELRRSIVDSENVVTRLTDRDLGRPERDVLGFTSYEVSIKVPLKIAEGPAVYRVVEVPRCDIWQQLFQSEVPYPDVPFNVTRDQMPRSSF